MKIDGYNFALVLLISLFVCCQSTAHNTEQIIQNTPDASGENIEVENIEAENIAPEIGRTEQNVKLDTSPEPPEKMVLVEALNSGETEIRWLRRGDTIMLGSINTALFPFIYRGGYEIRYRISGDILTVNGRPVGIRLNNNAASVSPALVNRYFGVMQSIIVVGSVELDPQVCKAIINMSAQGLSLELRLNDVLDPRLERLNGLGEKLERFGWKGRHTTRSPWFRNERYEFLSSLSHRQTQAGDAGLSYLSGLTNLRVLDLSYTRLSDADLAHLSVLPNLRVLDLSLTRVSDAGLSLLSGLSNLRELHLDGLHVSNAGLFHLLALTNLRVLDLSYSKVDDVDLSLLAGLSNLRALHLRGTQVSDVGLSHLLPLPNLRVLDLSFTRVGDTGLSLLAGLSNLRALHLTGTQVSDAGLSHLSGHTNLRVLYLGATQINDASLSHLSGLTNLRALSLGRTHVNGSGFIHLSSLTNLRELHLAVSGVNDSGLSHLIGLTNLRELNLVHTRVSDEAVTSFQSAHPDVRIVR